jgi:hypothetical protein
MRTGGMDKQFEEIFRRAFSSRVFPPHIVAKLGIKHVKGMLLHGAWAPVRILTLHLTPACARNHHAASAVSRKSQPPHSRAAISQLRRQGFARGERQWPLNEGPRSNLRVVCVGPAPSEANRLSELIFPPESLFESVATFTSSGGGAMFQARPARARRSSRGRLASC